MRKIFLLVIFFFGLLAGVFVFAEINYPVEELGNCQNEDECQAYCDSWENIEECVSFAEAHNLLSPEELAEAKKIIKALAGGAVPPGGCLNPTQCKAYCEEPTLIEECITFAEKAGIIPPSEAAEARQVRKALLAGIPLPGNCGTKKKCDAYCSKPAHMQECIQFARKAGLISAEEAAQAEKVMPLMAKGESPGGCKSKEECETYCADENHVEECIQFAQKAGLMTQEELKMFRKTKGKGPGGCKSKIECDAFCNNPANQEICFQFALDHDLIPPEKLQEIKEGAARLKQGLAQANSETLECIKTVVGKENLEKIKAGTFLPTQEMGDQIGACFDKYMSPHLESPPKGLPGSPPEGFIGPGGCATPEECEAYCADPAHYEECLKFMEF